MIPLNSIERDILAGEYVLGVLDQASRAVLAASLALDADPRRRVEQMSVPTREGRGSGDHLACTGRRGLWMQHIAETAEIGVSTLPCTLTDRPASSDRAPTA